MKYLSVVWIVVALSMFHLSCTKNDGPCTTCPPPPKDPRTYSWTVDTIAYPGSFQTLMRSIYATSPENVYIVGHNDNPGTPTMFRYDGAQWRTTNFHASEGGTISGAVSLSKIHGFGPSDIWVAGERIYQIGNTFPDSSFLMHFDGSYWTEAVIAGGRGRLLQSLWGATPTDIWAGGVNTLLHYDGVQWSHFPIQIPGQGIQFFSMGGLSSSEVYMMGWRPDVASPTDTVAYLLYHFDGSLWSVVDSMIQVFGSPPLRFGTILGNVPNALYSVRFGVFRKTGNEWQQLVSTNEPLLGVSGISQLNLFAVGLQTQVWHHNGSDWYRYPQLPSSSIDFYSVWADEAHVFAVGNDGLRTFVARGN